MKSMLQVLLILFGWASGSLNLAGSLRLCLRRLFKFISLYTRFTFLWFHTYPSFLMRWKKYGKPRLGLFSTSSFSLSTTSESSFFDW
jgi:hypothetical protein